MGQKRISHSRSPLSKSDSNARWSVTENAFSVPAADKDGAPAGLLNGVASLPRCFAGLNESAAMAIFANYRQLGTYMSGWPQLMSQDYAYQHQVEC